MRHAMLYLNDGFFVYDIIVFETSIFIRPHENENLAFWKISTAESAFEKMRFRWPFHRIRKDGYGRWAKPVEKHVFKQTQISVDGALNTHVINIKIQQWDLESCLRQRAVGNCMI